MVMQGFFLEVLQYSYLILKSFVITGINFDALFCIITLINFKRIYKTLCRLCYALFIGLSLFKERHIVIKIFVGAFILFACGFVLWYGKEC